MSDVFGRQDQVLAGALSSDSMFMTWPALVDSSGGLGLLTQQVGLDYRQPIRRVFEIGPGVIPMNVLTGDGDLSTFPVPFDTAANCDSDPSSEGCENRTQPTYYIVGKPEGRLQFANFVGPNALTAEFYTAYGNACGQNVITLRGKAGCLASGAGGTAMTWVMNGVVLDSIGMNVTAQEMVVQTQQSAMFAGLRLTTTSL